MVRYSRMHRADVCQSGQVESISKGHLDRSKVYDVVVVGAGAAGVGVAFALSDAGVENFAVVERYSVRRCYLP